MKQLRRRACAVIVHDGKVLGVRLADPLTNHVIVTVPGGAIEPGEAAEVAAERETVEETGYRVAIQASRVVVVRYDFSWGGEVFDCETAFFAGRLNQVRMPPRPVQDAAYHRGVIWVACEAAAEVFNFEPNCRQAIVSLV